MGWARTCSCVLQFLIGSLVPLIQALSPPSFSLLTSLPCSLLHPSRPSFPTHFPSLLNSPHPSGEEEPSPPPLCLPRHRHCPSPVEPQLSVGLRNCNTPRRGRGSPCRATQAQQRAHAHAETHAHARRCVTRRTCRSTPSAPGPRPTSTAPSIGHCRSASRPCSCSSPGQRHLASPLAPCLSSEPWHHDVRLPAS